MAVGPDLKPLLQRYASILTNFSEAKKLREQGTLGAAQQLIATTLQEYTAWSKDWSALQKANGVNVASPVDALKAAQKGAGG
jgi:hypothetical protein